MRSRFGLRIETNICSTNRVGEGCKLKGFAVTGDENSRDSSLPGSGHGECYRYG